VPENLAQVITKPNGAKEYRVSDHLASLRVAIEGATTRTTDYDPWGNVIAGSSSGERSTFNDQERDAETGLFDLSDRNLDPAIGAFSKPDRLLEKFRSVSPYNYCSANPVRVTDPDGMQQVIDKIWNDAAGAGGAGIGVGMLVKMGVDAMMGRTMTHSYTFGSQGEPIGIIDNRPLLNPPPPIIIIPGPRALLHPPPPIVLNSDGEAGKKAADYKFPTKKELAKELGVADKEVHGIVKEIAKQHEQEGQSIGTNNPDIGYDKADKKIVLKNPSTKKTIKTDTPLDSYSK
jgi:RHS repeat-associated protein